MSFFNKPAALDITRWQFLKQLHRADFEQWPFNAAKVRVACLEHDYAVIEVSGTIYALNGLSATKYKLRHIQDTEFYKQGESLREFIELALFLDPANKPGERKVFNLG